MAPTEHLSANTCFVCCNDPCTCRKGSPSSKEKIIARLRRVISDLETIHTDKNREIERLRRLVARVVEWQPPFPVEASLLDDLQAAADCSAIRATDEPGALRPGLERAIEILSKTDCYTAHGARDSGLAFADINTEHVKAFRDHVIDKLDAAIGASVPPPAAPVAWRKFIDSAYERHPRYYLREDTGIGAPEGWEPLYASPPRRPEPPCASLSAVESTLMRLNDDLLPLRAAAERHAALAIDNARNSIARALHDLRAALETDASREPDAQFFLDNDGAIDFGTPPVVTCEGCGNEIDPETCGCGDPIEGHSWSSGHAAIPMGCDCHRAPPSESGGL